jgi:type I restriction enzyme S subunit
MISEKKIGDVFKVTSGGTPSRKKQEYYKNGTIPWVKTGDLKGKYANEPKEYITELALANSSAKIFPKNTVLLAMYGATIGACSILKIAAATNQACGAILPSEKCDHVYLYYYLKSINKELISKGVGGAQPNISGGIIKSTKIPLPPLDQQKKIAAILDAADAYRQKTKALITKYDELIQSLFLDMFGDPVRNPKGWNVFSFKDVLEIRNGKNQKLIENKNGIYPICGSGGVMSYGDDYISEADSVIIGRKGNINKPILMKEKYWHVDTAFGLNPLRSVLEHDYLYWFCVRYNFEQHNKTVTIPSLTKETLLRIKIPIPHIDLQKQFSDSVQAIEAQKAQAQASLAQAEDLFNSLLQRAFKGELTY